MAIPEQFIEELMARTDIVDLVSEYVRLNKKGNSYWGLCPFHGEKTPSASTPTVTHREEVLLATNDTARFYLSGTEISNVRLNLYPTPSSLIKDPRYRLPTKLEVYGLLKQAVIPSGYWQSRQRIICYDTPTDFGTQIGSALVGNAVGRFAAPTT